MYRLLSGGARAVRHSPSDTYLPVVEIVGSEPRSLGRFGFARIKATIQTFSIRSNHPPRIGTTLILCTQLSGLKPRWKNQQIERQNIAV